MVRSIRYGLVVAVMTLSLGGVQSANAGFGSWINKTWNKAKKKVRKVARKARSAVRNAARKTKARVGKVWQSAQRKAKKTWNKARKTARRAVKKARRKVTRAWTKVRSTNWKKVAGRTWKAVKKGATRAKGFVDGIGKKIDQAASAGLDAAGLGVLKKLAPKAWSYVKNYSCDTLMDSAFKVSSWKRSQTSEGMWLAGSCSHEFNKGVICSVPNLIQNSAILLGEVVKSTWENKQYCVPAGLLMGGPSPAAIAPALTCGAIFYLAKEAVKVGKCLSGLGQKMSPATKRALLEEVFKFECNLIGELSVDLVVTVATAGASLPVSVTKYIAKLGKLPKATKRLRQLLDGAGKAMGAAGAVCR